MDFDVNLLKKRTLSVLGHSQCTELIVETAFENVKLPLHKAELETPWEIYKK